jgi:signal transduction histidine kinase
MAAWDENGAGRVPTYAGAAVLGLSVLLAGVEVGRVAVTADPHDVLIACVATAIFLPLHLWHLSYGLRGERPPGSGRTLAVIAAVHVVALLLIGPAWSFMLATLATSALIVLRPPWSFAVLAACVLGPAVAYAVRPDLSAAFGLGVGYLMFSVGFRAAIQFTLVWLVAASYRLSASRALLAREAAERERERVQAAVRASLEDGMVRLVEEGRRARTAINAPGVSEALVALDRVLVCSREALGDLRRIVAEARAADEPANAPGAAAEGLAVAARSARTPVALSLSLGRAWWPFVAVRAVIVGFLAGSILGVFGESGDRAWLLMPALALLTGFEVSIAAAVARGRRPAHAEARCLLAVALIVAVAPFATYAWEPAAWLAGSCVVLLLRGRARAVAAVAAGVALTAVDVALTIDALPGASMAMLAWNTLYLWALTSLSVVGLYGSARLVGLLAELDATRHTLAESAVRIERKRLSSDLHDVLGQTLTAISLKGDLARRLIDRDRDRAAAEVDDLVALATGQAGEMRAVASGEHEVAFDSEITNAIGLLEAAGIRVDADLALGRLDAETSMLLGFAVREGATNILRHARARECAIRAVREDGRLALELVNDGAAAPRMHGGTGIPGLADRLGAHDGLAEARALPGGRFVLRITLPEPVPA